MLSNSLQDLRTAMREARAQPQGRATKALQIKRLLLVCGRNQSQSLRCSAKNWAFTRRKLCCSVKCSLPLCVCVSVSLCLSLCRGRQVALLQSSLADAPLDERMDPLSPAPASASLQHVVCRGVVLSWIPQVTGSDVQQHCGVTLRIHTVGASGLGRAAVNTQ